MLKRENMLLYHCEVTYGRSKGNTFKVESPLLQLGQRLEIEAVTYSVAHIAFITRYEILTQTGTNKGISTVVSCEVKLSEC